MQAGEALVALDPTAATADRARLMHDVVQAELDRARLDGLQLAFAGAPPVLAAPPADASPIQLRATEAAMVAQDAEQVARLAGLDQQIAQKQAEGDEAAAALAKSQAKLEAGMAVTAEIKTGRRSVISYLLSPLQRYTHEGMTER